MKKIDLMIFDFDGTIVSTGADLVQSVNYTMDVLKLERKSEKEIISFIGDGVNKLMERVLGRNDNKYHEEAMNIFTGYYGEHLLNNTKLCPHVEEVLNNFINKTKIILTNKRYDFTFAIAQGLNIVQYFSEIIGADSVPFKKPDRRVIDYILNKYGVKKENTLMVGDGVNDVIAAKNAGILSCAYLKGLGNRDILLDLSADYYCEDILELNSLFR
ncbi:MAG: HAD-IA family hydrolase [Syntrophaceae bacterium]|nr:HAD-IA family hydrolase [Syntrophaceae bacterium]